MRGFARVDGLIGHIRNLGYRQGNEEALLAYEQRRGVLQCIFPFASLPLSFDFAYPNT